MLVDDIFLLLVDCCEGGFIGLLLVLIVCIFVDVVGFEVIVYDVCQDFYDVYCGNNVQFKFVYGM